jgi:hypothetical protein
MAARNEVRIFVPTRPVRQFGWTVHRRAAARPRREAELDAARGTEIVDDAVFAAGRARCRSGGRARSRGAGRTPGLPRHEPLQVSLDLDRVLLFRQPKRWDSLRTCVSTTMPCGSPSSAATTFAVFRATPGSRTSPRDGGAPARRTPAAASPSSDGSAFASAEEARRVDVALELSRAGLRGSPRGACTSRTAAR